MLETAAVCKLIAVNMKGITLNVEDLVKEMLFYDVGNLVKKRLCKVEATSESTKILEDYLFKRFNENEQLVNEFLWKIYEFSDKQIERLNKITSKNIIQIINSDEIEVKIEIYSVQKISKCVEEPFIRKIEEQIFENCNLKKEDIREERIEKISNLLRRTEFFQFELLEE